MQELRPWFGRAPITQPPEVGGYRLLRGEQLNIAKASLLGLLLVPVWWVMFLILVPLFGGDAIDSGTLSIPYVLVGISFAVLLVIFHELLHGLAILMTGNLPSFGIGPGFAYATVHAPLSRNAYIMVILMPLFVINVGAIVISIVWPATMGWALFLSILNTLGAGGDIWMFVRMLRVPRNALVVDLASGFAVYLPDQATTASPIEP